MWTEMEVEKVFVNAMWAAKWTVVVMVEKTMMIGDGSSGCGGDGKK